MSAREPHHRDNLAGIFWMVVSMAGFAVEDVLIKFATRALPIGEVLMLFGICGAVVFAGLARRDGASLLAARAFPRIMAIRAGFEFVGRLSYALAITLTPLSSATALLQAAPIVVVLGATLFFRETVDWPRWCGIVAGLLGVLIILRPAADDFSAMSLLAVVGTVGFAGRDLASRAVPASVSTWVLGWYGFLTLVCAGAAYSWWAGQPLVMPTVTGALTVLAAALTGVFSYTSLMKAMRTGSISVVTPFRYTRLIFGLTLGVVIFDERVDGPMVLGCAVVIGSGLFVWWHGARGSQRPKRAPGT